MSKKPNPKIEKSFYCKGRGAYSWDLGTICFGKKELPRFKKEDNEYTPPTINR